jgi:hypothetical protein
MQVFCICKDETNNDSVRSNVQEKNGTYRVPCPVERLPVGVTVILAID